MQRIKTLDTGTRAYDRGLYPVQQSTSCCVVVLSVQLSDVF